LRKSSGLLLSLRQLIEKAAAVLGLDLCTRLSQDGDHSISFAINEAQARSSGIPVYGPCERSVR
jgi:hypothetical protein